MADGRVVIDTDLDNRGFIAKSKEMLRAISSLQSTTVKTGNEIRRSASGFGTAMRQNANAMRTFVANANNAADRLVNLEDKLERMGNTRVNTKEFEKLNKEYEAAAEKANTLNDKLIKMEQLGKNYSPKYVRLSDQLKQSADDLRSLKGKVEEAEKYKKRYVTKKDEQGNYLSLDELEEARELSSELDKLMQQYDALKEKRAEIYKQYTDMRGTDEMLSDSYRSTRYDYEQAQSDAKSLYEKRQDMIDEGRAQQLYEETEEYRTLSDVFKTLVSRYNDMITAGRQALKPPDLQAWERMKTLSGMISEGFGRIQFAASMAGRAIIHPFQTLDRVLGFVASKAIGAASSLAKMAGNAALSYLKRLATNARNAAIQLAKIAGNAIATGIRNIGSMAADGAKKLLGLGRSAKQSGRGFKFSLFNLIKYGFGVRSVFVLVNRLRKALTDAFGVLAKKFPSFNKAMSQMVTALNRLKNSFGAAFAPIVTAAAPYITKFLNMLSDAMTRLGMFIAMLTGQKYYYQATAVQEDYAKSLDKTASSNKKAAKAQEEANRQLASFDELNILSDKDNSNTSPTTDAGAAFKQVPISGVTGWIAELKKAFEAGDFDEIGKVIAEKINEIFTKVDNLIKWDNVGATITKYIDAFTGVVNSMVDNINWDLIGKTVGDGIDTVINSFYQLATDVDWADIGTGIGNALNGLLDAVNWGRLGETVSAWLRSKFTVIRNAAATFNWGEAGTSFAEALKGLFDQKTFDELFDMFDTALGGIFEAIRTFVSEFSWGDAGTMFGNAINHLFTIVDAIKLGATLKKMILAAIEVVKNAIKEADFKAAGKVLADNLNDLFDTDEDGNVFAELGGIIDISIQGVLDFADAFLRNFHEEDLAESIRTFLQTAVGKINWSEIWELMGLAAKKAGNFLSVLLGGSSSRKSSVDLMWERNSLSDSARSSYKYDEYEDLGKNIAKAIGNGIAKVFSLGAELLKSFDAKKFGEDLQEAIKNMPWKDIAKSFWDLFSTALAKVADLLDAIKVGPFTLREIVEAAIAGTPFDLFNKYNLGQKLLENGLGEGREKTGSTSKIFDSDEDVLRQITLPRALKSSLENLGEAISNYVPMTLPDDLQVEAKKVEITDSKVEYEDENYIPMTLPDQNQLDALDALSGKTKPVLPSLPSKEFVAFSNGFNDAAKSVGSFIKIYGGATDKVSSGAKKIQSSIENMVSKTDEKMNRFQTVILGNAQGARNHLTGIVENMAYNTAYALDEMVLNTQNDTQAMGRDTSAMAQTMKSSVGSALDYIRSNSTLTANTMSSNARTAETNTSSAFARASYSIESSISNAFSSIANRDWYGLGNAISNGVTNAGHTILYYDWDYIGAAAMWGVQRGIDREAQYLYNQVRNIGYNLGRMMANVLRIGSPSKVFEYQGEMIGAGLSIGIESSGKESISVTEKVGQKIAEALNSIKAIDAIKNGLGIHTDASTYRTPQIATGTVMPYAIAAEAELTDADVLTEAIETSNDDLASVIIQAFNNATATIVQAIRENGGKGQSLDRRTLANAVIDEINQRTRAQGKSPLLI